MEDFFNKLLYYIVCLLISIFIMLPVTYVYTTYTDGVLFFSAFMIAFLCSFAGLVVWLKKYKEKFEAFLVFLTIFLFSGSFIYLGPVTLDRSLSSFIYFYAVQNGSVNSDIFSDNDDYFRPYVNRRFTDAEKIGFLKCGYDGICYPKFKTKFIYYSLYPFGKLTKTLTNYEEFKNMMDNRY